MQSSPTVIPFYNQKIILKIVFWKRTACSHKEKRKFPVVFKVQFTTRSQPVSNPESVYKGLKDIEYYEHNGMFKYTAGRFTKEDDAIKYKRELVKKGYKDAFVVKFENGVRK